MFQEKEATLAGTQCVRESSRAGVSKGPHRCVRSGRKLGPLRDLETESEGADLYVSGSLLHLRLGPNCRGRTASSKQTREMTMEGIRGSDSGSLLKAEALRSFLVDET